MSVPDHRLNPVLLGAACIIAGEFCFATMGVGIRMVADELSNPMIVFARNLVALALFAPWLLRDGLGVARTGVPWLHLLRALAGVAAMYCFFYAIAHLPLADAMLLKLTTPIFIPLIALLWLGERVSPLLWVALGVGFAGVVFILDPQPSTNVGGDWAGISPVALVGLLGGAFAAMALVTVRRLSRTEPMGRIVFYFSLIATLISALPLFWAWQWPSLPALGWLLWVGLAATLGQLALTRGLSLAPAARMGAFGYFAVVFGAGLGWLLWDEPITLSIVLGSLMVALAGVLASRAYARPAPSATTPADDLPTADPALAVIAAPVVVGGAGRPRPVTGEGRGDEGRGDKGRAAEHRVGEEGVGPQPGDRATPRAAEPSSAASR